MLKIIIILFALLTGLAANSQYTDIDTKAKALSKQDSKTVESLAQAISMIADTDALKVRAIFVWMSGNISYDLSMFKSGNVRDQTPEGVLKRKTAVCQGYSELFKKLCILTGVPCEVVAGYSKGFGYRQGRSFKNTDHAWNTVKINNQWMLLDATWGAGYLNENDDYVASFTEEHFLTAPHRFIIKHLPADPMWQLMKNPIDIKTFEKDSNYIKEAVTKNNSNIYINYLDTLSAWEKLDSTSKALYSYFRVVKANPLNADGWYKLGWHYYTLAWKRMEKLNDPKIQRDKNVAVPLANEAIYYLNQSNSYMKQVSGRDSFYGSDAKQKLQINANNIKNLQGIINQYK
ncbi:MAG: transglutaminase domain-containing protein [Cytophagales bacterium]|nr:transglutaminase domain-containing protein [Cytophagales bacterium]